MFVRRSTRPLEPARPAPPPRLTTTEGHFLAGFLDAEGCFHLRPNNGGTGWQCWMSLALRDDDAEILVALAQLTGLGRLVQAPARGPSKPQVVWHVVSHAECLRLTDLLRGFPLRGRKRREYEIWREAVHDLVDEPRPPSLPLAHTEIRALRRYVDPERRSTKPVELSDDALGPYLGGFFTGEGHLAISRRRVRTAVKVREDDRPLLEAFARSTGLGAVYVTPAYRNPNPAAVWIVHRSDQLSAAVQLLEHAGLRGRKRREFEVWREAAREAAKPAPQRSGRLLDSAAARLKETRAYRAPRDLPTRRDRSDDQKRGCAQVLREAASVVDGQLTTTAYEAVRATHPEWPTRNTIAIAFGGWAVALSAAGIGQRCSEHARAHAAARRREHTYGELLARRAARQRVVAAVTVLIDRGSRHRPTVHDYLAHRIANDRSLPSLSRLYNLFPGGWWSVLRQAGLPVEPPRPAQASVVHRTPRRPRAYNRS
jgi:hypothetical protein